jgi:acetate kinase
MSILVFNAGSSTLKFALFDEPRCAQLAAGMVDWRGNREAATLTIHCGTDAQQQMTSNVAGYDEAVAWILRSLTANKLDQPIRAVGHRVVHGGTEFRQAILINEQVSQSLSRIAPLAPLHNPLALTTITAARNAMPNAAQVAVFDTAFYANLPIRAYLYPLPYQWFEQYGIRRFGFHGISHAYCAARAAEVLDRQSDESLRLIICHLGNGCSITAVRGGQPLATSMGFTPLEGLMMGSRSGSIDPGILFYLLQQPDINAHQLEEALNRRSGLLGVSGISGDFRQVEQAAKSGSERAQLAIEMFADRIRSTIGSMFVTLGGVDGLVFTAGIGENSSSLRSLVCNGLQCLNLQLDDDKNRLGQVDADLATAQSSGRILLVQTREEQMIARETRQLINSP